MRSNGCRLDRVCKMPLAALPGATRRREARGQGGGLRPSSCPHSLRLGRSEGIKRLSRHKRCPPTGYPLYSTVRLTPSPLVGGPWRRFLDVALSAPFLTFSKRAVGPFLAGAGRRAESSAFRSTAGRQRAEGEASARCFTKNEQPTGQRYVTKTACGGRLRKRKIKHAKKVTRFSTAFADPSTADKRRERPKSNCFSVSPENV